MREDEETQCSGSGPSSANAPEVSDWEFVSRFLLLIVPLTMFSLSLISLHPLRRFCLFCFLGCRPWGRQRRGPLHQPPREAADESDKRRVDLVRSSDAKVSRTNCCCVIFIELWLVRWHILVSVLNYDKFNLHLILIIFHHEQHCILSLSLI